MPEPLANTGRAALTVGPGPGGRTVVRDLHGTGALAFRPTPWGAWLVGTAAHPIGGDRLGVEVDVGAGCGLEVRSLAATVARRGTPSCRSVFDVDARVGPGATLAWMVEPGVAAAGADHTSAAAVDLAGDSRLWWCDEFVLGRCGEEPGTWRSRLRVSVAGVPILASELAAGPGAAGWGSAAVLAGARAVSAVTIVDAGRQLPAVAEWARGPAASVVVLPLDGPGVQISAWGENLRACRELVAKATAGLRGVGWAPATSVS
jgi:urease accessory protein